MEQLRFDDLSRSLAKGLSRRRIVGALLGGLGALRLGRAEAACRQGGAGCSRDGQCCTGKCFKAAGVCSCTKTGKGRCKQPANRCRQTVCGDNGRCAPGANREQGFQCAPDKGCNASGQCVPHCEDGAENYGETDIDCGGSCLPCVTPGASCLDDGDCSGGVCCNAGCLACGTGQVCDPTADPGRQCCTPRAFCEACTSFNGEDGCGGRYECGSGENQAFCPPAPGIGFSEPQKCCIDGDCPCGKDSACCGDIEGDACFVQQTEDGPNEFCCMAQGTDYTVCGSVCCSTKCDESGECPRQSGRLGSYRRGTI